MSSESLHAFREIVSDVFRLAMQAAAGKYRDCPESFDRFLCTAMTLIESKENMKHTHSYLEKSMSNAMTEALLGHTDILPIHDPPHLIIHPLNEPGEDVIPNVVVTKDEHSEASSVIEPVEADDVHTQVVAVEADEEEANQLEDADADEDADEAAEEEADEDADADEEADEEAVEADEAEEEADEEAVEAEEEADEDADAVEEAEEKADEDADEEADNAEEEDDDFDIEKIGKKKYFIGKPTNRVYVFVSEEEYGDCIGKLENGKIVPL